MTSIRQQFNKVKKQVNADINDKIRETAEILADSLVEESKVDTGLHAANWLPAINKERRDDLEHEDFGIDRNKLKYPNKRLITEEAAKKIAKEIPKFKLGDEIVFSNSVPYAEDIDAVTNALAGTIVGIDRANREVNK